MKKLLLSTVLALGWFAAPVASHAQTPANCGVNYNPIIGVNCQNIRGASYVGQILGLVPQAAATDIWCITGSATKSIAIRRVELSGIATAATTVPITFIRRNSLDTAGTSSVPFITALNPNNPATTASVIQYTANPTINDSTSHQTIRVAYMTLTTAAATAVGGDNITWNFGTQVDAYSQGVDIPAGPTAAATQICINYGASTAAGNTLQGIVEWIEQ